jgi:hypothetical protein
VVACKINGGMQDANHRKISRCAYRDTRNCRTRRARLSRPYLLVGVEK